MAGKGSGLHGEVRCCSNQRLPGGVVAEGAKDGATHKGGGGTKSKDEAESRSVPDQEMPAGFDSGSQGSLRPAKPLTYRDYGGVKCNAAQSLPGGHFTEDGLSEGKATGAVRAADAYQGSRTGSETR